MVNHAGKKGAACWSPTRSASGGSPGSLTRPGRLSASHGDVVEEALKNAVEGVRGLEKRRMSGAAQDEAMIFPQISVCKPADVIEIDKRILRAVDDRDRNG